MARKPVSFEPEEQVEVPDADDMDDETFLKHLDKRHRHETGVETQLHKSVHAREAWVGAYRALHERQHEVNPDEHYDHIHVWDDDDESD